MLIDQEVEDPKAVEARTQGDVEALVLVMEYLGDENDGFPAANGQKKTPRLVRLETLRLDDDQGC